MTLQDDAALVRELAEGVIEKMDGHFGEPDLWMDVEQFDLAAEGMGVDGSDRAVAKYLAALSPATVLRILTQAEHSAARVEALERVVERQSNTLREVRYFMDEVAAFRLNDPCEGRKERGDDACWACEWKSLCDDAPNILAALDPQEVGSDE